MRGRVSSCHDCWSWNKAVKDIIGSSVKAVEY